MTNQHPITPPPELVQQWVDMLASRSDETVFSLAARWGADQQLEQDAKWLDSNALFSDHLTITPSGDALRQVMRPKPMSLKEQALAVLTQYMTGKTILTKDSVDTILRALEQLDD